ncbi:DsbA family protein [Glycomyces buryatensis]|uniref:Disulfide bond formation protein DsbA n=1 Tax=Glycomyces buryatensis TaxID=2570927 RepID=A0A4S8Q3N0_9ACTN|nr:thioredoxin domain-containing protein [Glycomyces buryatensis]THV35229.1 disulfide bond formation protein DsbA [Glycomyces buryatensis]
MATSSRKQAAAALRRQREAEARRKRIVFGVAIGAAVLLVGGLLGVGIWMNREVDYEVNEPAAETTDTHAVKIGDGPVQIDLYIDYLCPACKEFEDTYAADLQRWIDDGSVTVNYHPIAILDRLSQGTRYSTRAGAAAVCAADTGQQEFLDYTLALYAAQPAENTRGLDDDELERIGTEDVGLGAAFEACVEDETYRGWLGESTASATNEQSVTGTPTAKVNGQLVDPAAFADSVETAIASAS